MDIKFPNRFKEVHYVLQSKVEELRYLNYTSITDQKVWEYCVEKKWRKKDVESLPIHEMVSDIFRVSASDLINYIQISDQINRQSGLAHINLDELEMLLGKKNIK